MPPCLDVDDSGNLRYPLRQVEGIDAVRVRVGTAQDHSPAG